MKIATAGLIKIFFIFSLGLGCSHKTKNYTNPTQPTTAGAEASEKSLNLKFSNLTEDKRFNLQQADVYVFKNPKEFDLKVLNFKFNNQKELMSYLLNRRLLLHRTFQDDVAPYFGVIQSEKECMAKVDVKAEITKADADSEFFYMELPVNRNKIISDCHENNIWGLIRYVFYNCKKTNEVFEMRLIREAHESLPVLKTSC